MNQAVCRSSHRQRFAPAQKQDRPRILGHELSRRITRGLLLSGIATHIAAPLRFSNEQEHEIGRVRHFVSPDQTASDEHHTHGILFPPHLRRDAYFQEPSKPLELCRLLRVPAQFGLVPARLGETVPYASSSWEGRRTIPEEPRTKKARVMEETREAYSDRFCQAMTAALSSAYCLQPERGGKD